MDIIMSLKYSYLDPKQPLTEWNECGASFYRIAKFAKESLDSNSGGRVHGGVDGVSTEV